MESNASQDSENSLRNSDNSSLSSNNSSDEEDYSNLDSVKDSISGTLKKIYITTEYIYIMDQGKVSILPMIVSNFLQYDTATKAVSHSALNILASANGATYDFGGNNDVPVASINFDNLQITAPANGQVILKQGYAYGGALTANATVDNFKHYIFLIFF